jgi:hypothetical protein
MLMLTLLAPSLMLTVSLVNLNAPASPTGASELELLLEEEDVLDEELTLLEDELLLRDEDELDATNPPPFMARSIITATSARET